ncbi:MAG: hypothetical protein HOG49_21520 [Candidatus Scalindua sp.]|jgi:hypothetical protein|nr:hypothetical protein [Candidatus Scalindua sp.]
MSKLFLTPIDLNGLQLLNGVIHNLAADPGSPVDGQPWLNTTDNSLRVRINGVTKDLLTDIAVGAGTPALTATNNADGSVTLNIADADATDSGLMSNEDKVILDAATALATPDTLVIRDANGDIALNEGTVATVGAGSTSIANRAFVEGLVTGLLDFKGTVSGADAQYPVGLVGDVHIVGTAGATYATDGPAVAVGDMIVCIANSAAGIDSVVGGNWNILERNDQQATETVLGILKLATTAEVTAGTNDTNAVTPLKLQQKINAITAVSAKFAGDIGDAAATAIVVTHNLNDLDVVVQLKSNTTDDIVEADVDITSVNTVTITFAAAPALNDIRVVVLG